MIITGKTYDYLKYLAQILLPAIGTAYFALAGIWNLPSAQEVVGTIVVVDTFLGVLLGLSQSAYNNSDLKYAGDLNVTTNQGEKQFTLALNAPPHELENQSEVTFKVKPEA